MDLNRLNKNSVAQEFSNPTWLFSFPLLSPNEYVSYAIICVDDATGEVFAAQQI